VMRRAGGRSSRSTHAVLQRSYGVRLELDATWQVAFGRNMGAWGARLMRALG
jgi:hypothetical protein